ncbi:hypothetical protein [Mycobacterium parmense]|nr:hypothetical protein [Mycobacterium parmense]MCV7349034.1 hypothetical protein [Mycobacterium parmense]ORW58368.1 hypothetical protein AWC20_11700 [Mycobacterium parmense]
MHWTEVVAIERRLRIKPGGRLAVVNGPPESDSMFPMASGVDPDSASAVIGFAACREDLGLLDAVYAAAHTAAKVAWVGYPNPGRMVSDVHRDWVAGAVRRFGVEPVRHVSVDHNWSAVLLHPAGSSTPSQR